MRYRKLLQIAQWAGGVAAAFLILAGLLFALAQTGFAKRCLGTMAAEILSAKLDTEFKMGRITGILPFTIHVNHLAAADSENQEWLTIDGATLTWSPRYLLRGRFHIDELSAATVRLKTLPQKEQKEESGQTGLPTLPDNLPPITMDRFLVTRLVLDEPVLGRSAELTLKGHLSGSKSFSRIEGLLHAERIDGQKGHASIVFGYDRMNVPMLTINGSMEEGENGILLTLLGLDVKPPFGMTIDLQGPLTECKGKLAATAVDHGSFEAEIKLGKVDSGFFAAADGSLRVESVLLPKEFQPLLSGDSRFSISLDYRPEELLSLNAIRLTADGGSIYMSGSLSIPDQRLEGDINLDLDELSRVGGLIRSSCSGKLVARGRLSGSWHNPDLALNVLLEDAQIGDLRLSRFDGDFQTSFLGSPFVSFPGLRLQGKGVADDLSYPGFDAYRNKKLTWAIDADIPREGTIAFEGCKVADKNISLALTGTLDPATAEISALVDVEIVECGNLFPNSDVGFTGANTLQASIKGNLKSRSLTSRLEGKLTNLHAKNANITSLLGSEVRYSGNAGVSEGKRLDLSAVRIIAAAASATGDFSYAIPESKINGNWKVQLPSLSFLSQPAGQAVSGSAEFDGEISGQMSAMKVKTSLTGNDLVLGDNRFNNINKFIVNVVAEGTLRSVRGAVQLDALYADEKLQGRSDFIYDHQQLSLADISLTVPDASITGNLGFDLEKRLAEGAIEGHSEDLHALTSLAGEEMKGSGRLRAQFTKGARGQDLVLDLSVENLVARFGQAKELVLHADLRDILEALRGSGEISVRGFQKEDLHCESILLTVTGEEQKINFGGKANGRYFESFDLNTQGSLSLSPQTQRLDLLGIDGRYGEISFTLSQPTGLVKQDRDYLIEDSLFQIGSGNVMTSGTYQKDVLDLTATIQELPLQVLQLLGTPELSGTLSGSLHVAGRSENPEAELTLQSTNARIVGNALEEIPPAPVNVEAKVAEGQFQASMVFRNLAERPLKANLSFPVAFSLSPFSFSVPEKGLLRGQLAGDIDLSYLPAIFYLEDQALRGLASVDMTVAGNTGAPEIKGHAVVKNASYENANTGTILKDLNLEIETDNKKVLLRTGRANDGGEGVITAQGWLELEREKKFPFQADLGLEKATVLRQDNATANVSGKLKLSGFTDRMILDGALTINGAEILIPERLPPEVTELEVIEINKVDATEQSAFSSKAVDAKWLSLDLTVDSPGRVYLRGRGLDAELKGALSLVGNLSEPAIKGDLSLVRGYFNLFDKRFALISGIVTYDGSIPPSPTLEVRAERTQGDFTARVRLSGKLSAPQITLESDPPLPTDEIASRVLFGRSATSITPVQGLQLAQALESLSGRKLGMLDFMSRTRKILRVDRLSVEQSGENDEGVAVNVGKYLKEGIYVELEKGTGTESDQVSVEIEITPNITVESETGTDAEGGIGLNWKLDY